MSVPLHIIRARVIDAGADSRDVKRLEKTAYTSGYDWAVSAMRQHEPEAYERLMRLGLDEQANQAAEAEPK